MSLCYRDLLVLECDRGAVLGVSRPDSSSCAPWGCALRANQYRPYLPLNGTQSIQDALSDARWFCSPAGQSADEFFSLHSLAAINNLSECFKDFFHARGQSWRNTLSSGEYGAWHLPLFPPGHRRISLSSTNSSVSSSVAQSTTALTAQGCCLIHVATRLCSIGQNVSKSLRSRNAIRRCVRR